MELRLFQMKYPLEAVASWVNQQKIAEGVVAVLPCDMSPAERRNTGYHESMAYVFIRLPVEHPWAQDQIAREEKYKNISWRGI